MTHDAPLYCVFSRPQDAEQSLLAALGSRRPSVIAREVAPGGLWELSPSPNALPSWLELRSTLLLALGSRIPPLQPGALVAAVAQQLASRAQRLGVAESCTGGLLAHWLTQIPGSSAWFVGGVVAYSNALKVALLGVKHQTLDEFGAVSPETVSEMAAGALALPDCTLAVATSGVAGPTGGSPKKPVGTVEFALARANSPVAHTRAHFAGSRTEVQARAATFALHWVYALLFDPARTG